MTVVSAPAGLSAVFARPDEPNIHLPVVAVEVLGEHVDITGEAFVLDQYGQVVSLSKVDPTYANYKGWVLCGFENTFGEGDVEVSGAVYALRDC
jgi:hypothetical protein